MAAEMTRFQLFVRLATAVTPRPIFELLAFIFVYFLGKFENRVVNVEHDLNLLVYSDVQYLTRQFLIAGLEFPYLLLWHMLELLELALT